MTRASAGKREVVHRQQIAARRAAARRVQVRNRMLLAIGAVIAVVATVLTFVLVKVNSKPAAAPSADGPAGAALASVIKDLTSVPASVLDTVRAGSLSGAGIGGAGTSGGGYLTPVSGPPLASGGKPEVLYLGADFCPYCAAVRWPLIVALSRFGTFSGLRTTVSATANGAGQHEPYPGTPTWTFYGSRYTSRYLTFTPVELQTNIPDPKTGGYTGLQALTAAQQGLMTRYDSGGSIPFIDIGNAYLTSAFCKLTGNQPASACTPAVRTLESQLG